MAENLVINGVTYNGVDSIEMTTSDGKKVLYFEGQPVTIAQETGDSEDAVMSQSAVTKELGTLSGQIANKQPKGDYALKSEAVPVEKPIDETWANWQDVRYNYGFNPAVQPIYNTVKGTLESDTMMSVQGGKGRWGWHVFEGWSPNNLSRLTMLTGKHHETFGYIQMFSPNGLYDAGRNRWGWVKLGCDTLNEGTDFSKNWATCYTPITLAPQSAPTSVADYDINPQLTSNSVPVGTMYFDETEQRIKIYTKTGWQPIAFVGEGGGSSDEDIFYEPIVSYRNDHYVSVESGQIGGSVGRLAFFRLNKNTKYTVTRSRLSVRFRIYLYYNTSIDAALENNEQGMLIAQDSSNNVLETLTFTNTDYAMAVVMLANNSDTTTEITAEIVE